MRTKLIMLMFHRVVDVNQQFDANKFERYIQYLKNTFTICDPFGPLTLKTLNICLSFDDAYCDFYFYVYPLLKRYNIKAILGVSTDYIMESTSLNSETRLSVPYPDGMHSTIWRDKVPFCTWQELKEMSDSGHVIMASHSASHPHLTDPNCDLKKEIIDSKNILEEKLQHPINSFIYPYGDYNRQVHKLVKQHYQWDLRIGSALNYDWPEKSPIYRIDAEKYWPQNEAFSEKSLRKMTMKYWLNRLRGR